jgi:hypothetical protein
VLRLSIIQAVPLPSFLRNTYDNPYVVWREKVPERKEKVAELFSI